MVARRSRHVVHIQAVQAPLAARGESPASHRGRRGAPLTRRDDREYRAIFEGGATQPAGMHRRPNAAGVSPRAASELVDQPRDFHLPDYRRLHGVVKEAAHRKPHTRTIRES